KRHNGKDRLSQRACLSAFDAQEVLEILPYAHIRPGASQIILALWFQDWSISTRARCGGVALRVILGAALWVNQNIPGMRELHKGFGRATVEIRMLQAREPLVCRLDLFCLGSALDPENLIIIDHSLSPQSAPYLTPQA